MNIVHIVWYKLSDLLASYHLFIWNTLLYFYLWPGWLIYSYPYLSNAFISDTLVSLSLQCITMMWSIILYWHPLLSIWAASSSWYSNKTVRIFCEHLARDLPTLPGCVSWPHPLSWCNIVSIAPYFQMDLNPQLVLRLASPVDFDLHQINPIFGKKQIMHIFCRILQQSIGFKMSIYWIVLKAVLERLTNSENSARLSATFTVRK